MSAAQRVAAKQEKLPATIKESLTSAMNLIDFASRKLDSSCSDCKHCGFARKNKWRQAQAKVELNAMARKIAKMLGSVE